MKKPLVFILSAVVALLAAVGLIVMISPSQTSEQKTVKKFVSAVADGNADKVKKLLSADALGVADLDLDDDGVDPAVQLLRKCGIGCPSELYEGEDADVTENDGAEEKNKDEKSEKTKKPELKCVKVVAFFIDEDEEPVTALSTRCDVNALIEVTYKDKEGETQTYMNGVTVTLVKEGSDWKISDIN